jgi:hypothetical protein
VDRNTFAEVVAFHPVAGSKALLEVPASSFETERVDTPSILDHTVRQSRTHEHPVVPDGDASAEPIVLFDFRRPQHFVFRVLALSKGRPSDRKRSR